MGAAGPDFTIEQEVGQELNRAAVCRGLMG